MLKLICLAVVCLPTAVLAEDTWRPSYADGPRTTELRQPLRPAPLPTIHIGQGVRRSLPVLTDAEQFDAPAWACRVWVAENGGERSGGSGAVIELQDIGGRRAATVVTNYHVAGAGANGATISVEFGRGVSKKHIRGRWLGGSEYYDLAYILIWSPSDDCLPLQIAIATPEPRRRLSIFGFGGMGQGFRRARGWLAGFSKRSPQDPEPPDFVMAGTMARSGDSGGPVLDEETGELAGILWGTTSDDGGQVFAIDCETVRKVAVDVLGREVDCGPYGPCPNPFGRQQRPRPQQPDDGDIPPGPGDDGLSPPSEARPGGCDCERVVAALNAHIADLRLEIAALHRQILEQEGDDSDNDAPPNHNGDCQPGDDCADLQAQLDALQTQMIVLQKKKLTVQILDEQGQVRQQTQTELGGTLRLQLKPVKPRS